MSCFVGVSCVIWHRYRHLVNKSESANYLLRALTFVVTFVLGLSVASFHSKPHSLRSTIRKMGTTEVYKNGLGFSEKDVEINSALGYFRYSCSRESSAAVAEQDLQDQLHLVTLVEQTVVYSDRGEQVGQRKVLEDGEILWTEGPTLHRIIGPTVSSALSFENSLKVHQDIYGCWEIPPFETHTQTSSGGKQ